MISELTFIRHYSSFWNQLLPGVDHYVRLINSGLKQRVDTPVYIEDLPNRRAIVNSVSYKIFYKISKKQIRSVEDVTANSALLEEIKSEEINRMSQLDNTGTFADSFSQNEIEIIKILSKRLISFFPATNSVVYPKFDGCGILFECYGDIYINKTLYEIKAGEGNFKRQDLFQLLVYAALNNTMENKYNIENIALFNPRTGLVWTENIDKVSVILSGYSTSELFSEIIDFVSNNYRSI